MNKQNYMYMYVHYCVVVLMSYKTAFALEVFSELLYFIHPKYETFTNKRKEMETFKQK